MANEKDKSRLERLEEELKEEMKEIEDEANLPNDFALSGGTGPHTVQDHHEEIEKEEEENEDNKKTSFRKDLDTEFPLSGGETEE